MSYSSPCTLPLTPYTLLSTTYSGLLWRARPGPVPIQQVDFSLRRAHIPLPADIPLLPTPLLSLLRSASSCTHSLTPLNTDFLKQGVAGSHPSSGHVSLLSLLTPPYPQALLRSPSGTHSVTCSEGTKWGYAAGVCPNPTTNLYASGRLLHPRPFHTHSCGYGLYS